MFVSCRHVARSVYGSTRSLLVFHKDCTFFIQMVLEGNQLWIRSPIGFVWRDLRYPADPDHPESFLLLDDGSVLVFRRAVLALQRSDSPVLRADVSSWYDDSDSGVECDIGSAFVSF